MRTAQELVVRRKKVLIRCDFNVPLNEKGDILDDFKIKSAGPTIRYLLDQEARMILMSHLGDPGGRIVAKLKLNNIQESLASFLGLPVAKTKDCIGAEAEKRAERLQPGEIILLENLRFHKEEEANNVAFAKKLAKLGDVFLNDAFACSHRNHASFNVAKYLPAAVGLLLEKEVKSLNQIKNNPAKPLVAILAGRAKGIETKARFINSICREADFVLLGNLVADELGKKDIKIESPEKVIFPLDSTEGLDIGPETIRIFKEKISKAKTVFWSGPLGKIEEKKFSKGSKEILKAIIKSKAFSVVGGGETSWFINEMGLADKIGHLSTGGDALLLFLSGEKLPGIEVLN